MSHVTEELLHNTKSWGVLSVMGVNGCLRPKEKI